MYRADEASNEARHNYLDVHFEADEASNEARHNYLDVHFVRVTHSSPFLMYLNMSPVLVEVL